MTEIHFPGKGKEREKKWEGERIEKKVGEMD
jgi:hypothetical protein